jgi:hypothetical protein
MPRKKTIKRPPGKAPSPIDWDRIDSLLMAGCSGVECAAAIGVHENTLYARCVTDKGCEFVAYKAEKQSKGDGFIRAKQYQVAVNDGDKAMLIWLGKQRLGQRDKLDTTTNGESLNREIIIQIEGKDIQLQ